MLASSNLHCCRIKGGGHQGQWLRLTKAKDLKLSPERGWRKNKVEINVISYIILN